MSDDVTPLASLSLTHVHYDAQDPISYVCALLALSPQFICATYAILVYATREIEIGLMFAGQLACEALNIVLKRYFKGERPPRIRHLGKGYGMPSSHAQFVAYFAVYGALWVWWRHTPSLPYGMRSGRSGSSNKVGISEVYRLQLRHPRLTHALLSVAFVVLAVATAASRVYLHYHTVAQVVVGGGVGAACALAWFVATELARRLGWVDWMLDFGVMRQARIRDLCCEEDLVELGWRLWEEKRRARRDDGDADEKHKKDE